MPCILHCNAKKIRDTISSQVSGRAQLPGVIIYIVDHFGNYFISGGHTCTIWAHPTVQCVKQGKNIATGETSQAITSLTILTLQGSFTIFLFSVRTHILDSNEVWYS